MEDLHRAKAILNTGSYTCVLCWGEFFETATARGVRPLVDWLDSGRDYRDFSAADKVVGRATAFLYRLLGVRAVHAQVMSTPAREALEAGGIAASCDREVSGIINRAGTGPCPFENAVLGIRDPAAALTAIRKQQLRMRMPRALQHLADREFSLDRWGQSGATVAMFGDAVLKCSPDGQEARQELAMLRFLAGKLPVPSVLETVTEDGFLWVLMTRLPGRMAFELREDPWALTRLLADLLNTLWHLDLEGCPGDQSLEARFRRLEARPLTLDASVDRRDFPTPEHMFQWLQTHRPAEERVLIHGDFCLPNLFVEDGHICGLLDLGRSGPGDPWADIAICWRSLRDNFGGHYGPAVEGFHADCLFEALGIPKDPERLRYYLNLDELY